MAKLIYMDDHGKEFELNLTKKNAFEVIFDLIENKRLTTQFCHKVVTTSDDEILVSTIIENAWNCGNLTDTALLKILKRFPESEVIQKNMIYYCDQNGRINIIKELCEFGITKKIRKQAFEATLPVPM